MNKRTLLLSAVILILVLAAVAAAVYANTRPYVPSNDLQIRSSVYGFGDQLSQVSLTSKADVIAKDMEVHYAYYIHPDLLASWKEHPLLAPGRETVKPWSDRIEINTVTLNKDGTYMVDGSIIAKGNGQASSTPAQIPIRLILTQGPDGWQTTTFETVSTP